MYTSEYWMRRCLELALKGAGKVSPNPRVGCVIVHQNRIIGEGYHTNFGGPHAEVHAIRSVENKSLLKESTLYVNLEPCAHYGKTPPCADLIVEHHIPRVVIGCIDSYAEVAGRGIARLRKAGIQVDVGILKNESLDLNRRFFHFFRHKKPYIVLKWAQTEDGFIGPENGERIDISNHFSHVLSHKWRAEEDAILVGRRTVQTDNPQLNIRNWYGKNPVRLIIDPDYRITENFAIWNGSATTFRFCREKFVQKDSDVGLDFDKPIPPQIEHFLYTQGIQSVIIEGGSQTLTSFILTNCWDEARVFVSPKYLIQGIKAPILPAPALRSEFIDQDKIRFYRNNRT